jgi:23S rRNA pseudouridine1911/1915/1917 synthase
MHKTIEFLVNKKNNGERIDVFLSKEITNLTRSYIKKLIEKNNVKLNKIINITPSTKIKTNDKIIINIIEEENLAIIPNKIKLDVVYEDNDLLIVNKPKGMVVHPGAGNYENTLVNALIYKYKNSLSNINGSSRPGIVHRIDKETSGLLVVAKNNLSHSSLGNQFSNHTIERKYQCLVWGVVRPLSGRIETLISRNKKNRQLMTVSDVNGKKAITNYKTIKVFNIKDIPKISFLECQLETGRTHQIRVHLKYKGVSLLGDKQYGKNNVKYKKINKEFYNLLSNLSGQALHAQTLGFLHPTKKRRVSFKSSLPSGFKKILDLLNNLSG